MHGIGVGKPKLDWAALIDREKEMIGGIPDSLAETLQERGVDLFRDSANFVGRNAVRVGNRTIEAQHIVIATGSRPRPLPIPGAELMITSDEVLSEREQPGSVVFVGGGVIALELSHVYARAGTKVTILEALPRLLPALDEDAVEQIRSESERIGIEVHAGVKSRPRREIRQSAPHRVRRQWQGAVGGIRPGGQRRWPHRQCRSSRSGRRRRRS